MGYQEYDCDICGSGQWIEVPQIRKYTNGQVVRICKDCGLVYYNKRRTPQEIAKYWDETLYDDGTYDPLRPIVTSRHVFARDFIKKNLSIRNKIIFDIGIGEGQFLELMRKENAVVQGVESTKRNSTILQEKGIPHFLGTIEDYAQIMPQKKYEMADIATILFTLQNSQSATDMVETAYDILKEEGHIFIQMGSRILVPFKKPMGTYFNELIQDEQPYHFSFGTLQCLLAKCGFEIVTTNHYWDDDLLCVLAVKRPKDLKIKWLKDDYKAVEEWFKHWHAESERMKKYLPLPFFNYDFPSYHTFYREISRYQ